MDEIYIDGKENNKHKNKKSLTGFINKTLLAGIKVKNGSIIVRKEKI